MRFRRGPTAGVVDRARVRASYLEEQMLGFAAGALGGSKRGSLDTVRRRWVRLVTHLKSIWVSSGLESVASAREWFERAAAASKVKRF